MQENVKFYTSLVGVLTYIYSLLILLKIDIHVVMLLSSYHIMHIFISNSIMYAVMELTLVVGGTKSHLYSLLS